MGLEELTHVMALWIALFYAAATTAAIMRIEMIFGWELYLLIALFSITMGITMIAGLYFEPRRGGYGKHYSDIDYTSKKIHRLFVCLFILIFVAWPFGAINWSPTPLADFLSLTLITYVWLLYVAIMVISVFYYDGPEEVIEE